MYFWKHFNYQNIKSIFVKQINDLKNNPKIIFQKLKTFISLLYRLIFLPINLSIILFIVIINRFFLIRIGFHKSKWLGTWLMSSEIYLQEKKKNKIKSLDIFIIDKVVANQLVYKKIKNKIITIPFIFHDIFKILTYLKYKNNYFVKFIARRKALNLNDINYNNKDDSLAQFQLEHKNFYYMNYNNQAIDTEQVLVQTEVELSLNYKEIEKGKKILSENVKKDYKGVVLLCVRNSDYYKSKFPDFDAKFMTYRDYNLSEFIPAANYLTSKGYLVIRMGYNLEKLEVNNDLIIDYSHANWRSELMDYYLGYACDFCISTAFGADSFARLHRKPMGLVVSNLDELYYLNDQITHIFSHIKKKNIEGYLSLREIFENKMNITKNIQAIDKTNFEIVKNSSEEIKDLAIEVTQKFEKSYEIKKNEIELQNNFWDIYFNYKKKITKVPKLKYRLVNSFLKKNYEN